MFGSTTNTGFGAFGTSSTNNTAPNTSTSITPSLFGNAPTTIPSFGSVPTTTASFGSAPPATGNSLFGSSQAPIGGSLFASSQPAKPAGTLFSNAPPVTGSLFGAPSTSTATTQPQKGYLDLDTCFPDTKVPHFVVTPHGLTRTVVPANFFYGTNARDTNVASSESKNREPLLTSIGFSESNKTLPNYLTSSENNSSTTSNNKSPIRNFGTKKRVLDGSNLDIGRNVLTKNEQGVFTHMDNMTSGFDKNLNRMGSGLPPIESLSDTGIQTSASQQVGLYTKPDTMNEMANPFGLFNTSVVDSNKTRVRVFGYDQKNVENIIKYFTNLGELTEPCKCQGNWITFNYVSPEIALKAIECNGMNIDQNHLVGVTWDERAKQVENLHYQPAHESNDLYKKNNSFMNIFSPNQTKLQNREQKLVDKIREKLLGW